jgi:hypothetical protein
MEAKRSQRQSNCGKEAAKKREDRLIIPKPRRKHATDL